MMGMGEAEAAVKSAFEDAETVEFWFWDGDLGHALGTVSGEESDWLLERGILIEEDDQMAGVDNLIEGDVVYRCRKARGLEGSEDPRARNFDWQLVDPYTGEIQATAIKLIPHDE
jgi:hypothetical protein